MIAAGLVRASSSRAAARLVSPLAAAPDRRAVWRPSGQEDDLVAPAAQQFQVAADRRAGRLYRLLAAAAAG
jgi:hypothetical protein